MDMSTHEEDRAVAGLLVVLLRSLQHGSQAELARATGIPKSQISLYELWRSVPSEANLRRIAAACGVRWAEVRRALPALRALYRLALADQRPALPGIRRVSLAVGQAAAGALHRSVLPFLEERLPFAGPEPPAPETLPDRETEPAALGLLIVLLRSLRHWSQVELASVSRVQRSQLSAYELGKRRPRRQALERLALAVGIPLEEALDGLPFLRELVRASQGRPGGTAGMADGARRFAEGIFLLEVGPFLAEQLRVDHSFVGANVSRG